MAQRVWYGNQERVWRLSQQNKVRLQEDRRRRAAKAGSMVESILASNPHMIREAWIQMRGWYKDAVDCPPPLARVTIYHITEEQVDMYWHIPFPVQSIPVERNPFPIEKSFPKDKDISWVVRRIRPNRLGLTLVMWAEHLCKLSHKATQ